MEKKGGREFVPLLFGGSGWVYTSVDSPSPRFPSGWAERSTIEPRRGRTPPAGHAGFHEGNSAISHLRESEQKGLAAWARTHKLGVAAQIVAAGSAR